jgi:hypothetical protein
MVPGGRRRELANAVRAAIDAELGRLGSGATAASGARPAALASDTA